MTPNLDRLRALRLWHWREAMAIRHDVQLMRARPAIKALYEASIAMHLGFIQTLNDFFPNGDTAERDAAS